MTIPEHHHPSIERRLDGLGQTLDRLERRIDRLESRVGRVEDAVEQSYAVLLEIRDGIRQP